MTQNKGKMCVYFDGACPKCIRDRQSFERLAGKAGEQICWIDITTQEQQLIETGIDPAKALTELHVKDENGQIHSELDAYIMIMNRVTLMRPLAWLTGLPLIRPALAGIYHWRVNRRLRRSGRLPV